MEEAYFICKVFCAQGVELGDGKVRPERTPAVLSEQKSSSGVLKMRVCQALQDLQLEESRDCRGRREPGSLELSNA